MNLLEIVAKMDRGLRALARRAWLFARAAFTFLRKALRHRVARDVLAAGALALLVLLAAGLSFERIRPGEIGVRQANWGAARAIEAVDRGPGLYFGPKLFYSWHRLDARTRTLTFAEAFEGGEFRPLEVRARSGNTAQVSVSVPYRIAPGAAHRIVEEGIKLAYPMRVKATVEKVLVEELSRLDTDEFATTEARRAVCATALERLNAELAPLHVVADGVYVRGILFSETYEKKKQEEQLASQTLETNQVLEKLKFERLENQFKAQSLDQEKEALISERNRVFAEEQVRWENHRIEDQKLEIQFLTHELAKEKQQLLGELTRDFEARQVEERDRARARQQLENQAVAQSIDREEQELVAQLSAELDRARAEAEGSIEERRVQNELVARELAREAQALSAERDLAIQAERIRLEGQQLAAQRAAERRDQERRREADQAHAALVAAGEEVVAQAEALREELAAAALGTPGARLYLAREAASNLNLERVSLNSNDPRVPSVLDLDALVGLLVGTGE